MWLMRTEGGGKSLNDFFRIIFELGCCFYARLIILLFRENELEVALLLLSYIKPYMACRSDIECRLHCP